MMRVRSSKTDTGQATVLMLAVVALVVVMMVATARFAGHLETRQQAQIAADAAALAGTTGGQAAAARLAQRNGGLLLSFDEAGGVVWVTVMVDEITAAARATRAP